MKHSWDIFCAVVDNFGDIGVCWRLARQLNADLGQSVRLWVDDLASFQRLRPAVDSARETQTVDGIEVRRWNQQFPVVQPADVVIEGFGVKLPDNYLESMAAMQRPPVWINLEHISAETWVDSHHLLPSPHPRLPLTKYFFFPGFTHKTGGVLIESYVVSARTLFQSDPQPRRDFLHALGVDCDEDAFCVSLFSYENAALGELIESWSGGAMPMTCLVPAGRALDAIEHVVGIALAPGQVVKRGRLTLAAIPFLDVDQYDRLLWACDLNFVRGEDSFVRAQLAARPLIWQAYVQADDAHLAKERAFLERYLEGLDSATADAWRSLNETWNRQSPGAGRCWDAFMRRRTAVSAHANAWAGHLVARGDLAAKLADFCLNRLK